MRHYHKIQFWHFKDISNQTMWLTFGLPMYICIDSTVEAINDGQLWLDLQRFVGLYCLFIQPQITPNSAWVATKSPVRHSVSRSHAHLSLWRWRLDRKATTSSFTWCHSWLLAILRAQEVAFFCQPVKLTSKTIGKQKAIAEKPRDAIYYFSNVVTYEEPQNVAQ